jgi:hypothetical protein
MVNTTMLSKITKLIESEGRMKPMLKWSLRFRYTNVPTGDKRSWYMKKLKKEIKQILFIISGNDVVEMLKG